MKNGFKPFLLAILLSKFFFLFYINGLQAQKLNQNFSNYLKKYSFLAHDLYKLLESKNSCNAEIHGIKVHSLILDARLGSNAIERLNYIFITKGVSKNYIKVFLIWVYTGYCSRQFVSVMNDICNKLNVNFDAKNGFEALKLDMKHFFYERYENSDFSIGNWFRGFTQFEDQTIVFSIPCHKFILGSRTKNLDFCYLDFNFATWMSMLEFLYTGDIQSEIREEHGMFVRRLGELLGVRMQELDHILELRRR